MSKSFKIVFEKDRMKQPNFGDGLFLCLKKEMIRGHGLFSLCIGSMWEEDDGEKFWVVDGEKLNDKHEIVAWALLPEIIDI